MIWLVWLAISLLINTSWSRQQEAHRMVQEQVDLSVEGQEM
jgi:hypothetical protein